MACNIATTKSFQHHLTRTHNSLVFFRTYKSIKQVLNDVMDAGYSAGSVLFGMGGGLLQVSFVC
jgi:biotin synthase-like enzyme